MPEVKDGSSALVFRIGLEDGARLTIRGEDGGEIKGGCMRIDDQPCGPNLYNAVTSPVFQNPFPEVLACLNVDSLVEALHRQILEAWKMRGGKCGIRLESMPNAVETADVLIPAPHGALAIEAVSLALISKISSLLSRKMNDVERTLVDKVRSVV